MTTREQREQAIREAGWNTFLLRSADVTIDLLTDSGTTAMSTEQWAAYDGAHATPATSEAYHRFVGAMQEIYGYEYILPTHQGRAAEHIQSEVLIKPGQFVPGNMYFTTTKVHQELAGGIFVDVIVDEAHEPESEFPWKGNIDLRKLDAIVQEHGAAKVAYISFELSVNMAGGQPVIDGQPARGLRVLPPEGDPGPLRRDARRRERLLHPEARPALHGTRRSATSCAR